MTDSKLTPSSTTPDRVTLDTLKIGQEAQIERLRGGRTNAQRLQEMGLIPGTTVRVLKFAPLGDPIELMLRGYHLTLRKEEASFIEVTLKSE